MAKSTHFGKASKRVGAIGKNRQEYMVGME